MSSYPILNSSPKRYTLSDADLLLRLSIALAARQRAAWRAVRVRAHNGIVRLEGALPSFHDRQLILAIATHVAGVLRVEDELSIAEPGSNGDGPIAATSVESNHGGTEVKQTVPPNAFYHLPVLDESLEYILSKRAQADAAAG